MERKLKSFLAPKTIAVIGASSTEGKVGHILMEKLSNFKGKVIPINPKHGEILGKKAYPSLHECREKIDLAVIAIPAEFVRKAIEDCARKKIRNVIVISAGFSEVGKKEMETELLRTARKNKINLLGPNCFGVANPSINLDTTFANTSASKGNIAFISQSGALWSYTADLNLEQGFSGFVSLGNMADLGFTHFIKYFNKDRKTKKIVLYVEKLKHGKEFIRACKKSRKEIIVIKSGQTTEGNQAVISHTGSLATDFAIYKGAFKQAGITLVNSLAEALGIKAEPPQFKKLKTAIVTNAGGAGALITDYLIQQGIPTQPPIDILGTATPEDYKRTIEKLKSFSNIVVVLTPQSMSNPTETAKILANSKYKKRITAFFLGEKSMTQAKIILKRAGIPCYTKI